jgi:hypothetical protein
MEATHSSETFVFTRPAWRHIPEDGLFKTVINLWFKTKCEENAFILLSSNIQALFKIVINLWF